ncbi:MAG TPA: hypothetical protein VGF28_13765 [Thermoanaerobaculia bacterium]
MDAYNRRDPHRPFAIDDAASRILENDPDYHPPAPSRREQEAAAHKESRHLHGKRLTSRLGTTVGELLGEPGHEITANDLRNFRWISDFLRMRFRSRDVASGMRCGADHARQHDPVAVYVENEGGLFGY